MRACGRKPDQTANRSACAYFSNAKQNVPAGLVHSILQGPGCEKLMLYADVDIKGWLRPEGTVVLSFSAPAFASLTKLCLHFLDIPNRVLSISLPRSLRPHTLVLEAGAVDIRFSCEDVLALVETLEEVCVLVTDKDFLKRNLWMDNPTVTSILNLFRSPALPSHAVFMQVNHCSSCLMLCCSLISM
jgi:hypothetical protein